MGHKDDETENVFTHFDKVVIKKYLEEVKRQQELREKEKDFNFNVMIGHGSVEEKDKDK